MSSCSKLRGLHRVGQRAGTLGPQCRVPPRALRAVGSSGVLSDRSAVGVLVDPHARGSPASKRRRGPAGRAQSSTRRSRAGHRSVSGRRRASWLTTWGSSGPSTASAVAHAAGRAGQVDDQRAPGDPGQPAGQHRRRHAVVRAVRADRLGDARAASRSSTARVTSGVRSVGESPVPPVVRTTSYADVHRRAQHRLELGVVVGHAPAGPSTSKPSSPQPLGEHRPAAVLVDAGRARLDAVTTSALTGVDRERRGHRVHSPLLPAGLRSSSRTSVIAAPRVDRLHHVDHASARRRRPQVSASISTPVRSAVRAVAVISTASSVTSRSTVDAVQRDRVAQRHQVRRPLGRLDAGDPGDGERVALGHARRRAAGRRPPG